MIVIIMLFIILSISFAIKIKLNISQEESLLIAVFGMTILGYLLGLINLLVLSVYIIAFIAAIALIYTLIKLKKKEIKVKEIITIPTIIYCITIGFIYYIVKDISFSYYDEYMFWGANLKEMFYKSYLWAHHSIDGIHTIYPPFTAITEYIFLKFNGIYREGIAYFAIVTLILTAFMPLLKNERYSIKSLIKTILLIVVTYVSIVLFSYNIVNLSVDCILAILFAVAMFWVYKLENKKDYIVLTILLIAMTLTKVNGILFAGIVIMQIFIKELLIFLEQKDKTWKKLLKKIYIVLILLTTIIMVYATWKFYCLANGKQIDDRHDKNYVQNIDIEELINAIKQDEEADERNRDVVNDFLYNLDNKKIIRKNKYNTPTNIFIILNLLFMFYIIISKEKIKKISNLISINIGIIIYMLTVIILFMFVFVEEQGNELLGFTRYVSTYLLAMLLNLIYLIFEETEWKRILVIALMLIIMQKGLNQLMLNPKYAHKILENPNEIITIENANYIKNSIKESEKVYLIDQQEDNGYEFMKTRYYILPIKTNLLYEWNIGTEKKDNFYKIIISEEEFIDKLIEENYTYVYVINSDEKLIEDYQNIFSPLAQTALKEIMIYEDIPTITNGVLLKVDKELRLIKHIEECGD